MIVANCLAAFPPEGTKDQPASFATGAGETVMPKLEILFLVAKDYAGDINEDGEDSQNGRETYHSHDLSDRHYGYSKFQFYGRDDNDDSMSYDPLGYYEDDDRSSASESYGDSSSFHQGQRGGGRAGYGAYNYHQQRKARPFYQHGSKFASQLGMDLSSPYHHDDRQGAWGGKGGEYGSYGGQALSSLHDSTASLGTHHSSTSLGRVITKGDERLTGAEIEYRTNENWWVPATVLDYARRTGRFRILLKESGQNFWVDLKDSKVRLAHEHPSLAYKRQRSGSEEDDEEDDDDVDERDMMEWKRRKLSMMSSDNMYHKARVSETTHENLK